MNKVISEKPVCDHTRNLLHEAIGRVVQLKCVGRKKPMKGRIIELSDLKKTVTLEIDAVPGSEVVVYFNNVVSVGRNQCELYKKEN